ncbi:uncharacterized membrane protein YjjB (DUF3815 family) [Rhodobacter aestuarii]|uniref:Uncharacterized membrane protein YjjB, DUF3815 family n=1 Tax=Rhodobacter aestuarii TaxID=453582 RepID=A0A1N7L097_9RHOB|nr:MULTISPECIES: threonine/serine exporter family protein [Rhodobacter]PTV95467.1 uncharacterized membrane protein YjjB (DUF3815 family) [Rhodobacter aestuarii]SIS67254.1 Uncharacterized membrane protein YjjB, DUF3815 family [Rhodobacter aestuarii]SOB90001.1 uncharacterized membrane protein YjjB [Rhodobacter sp. JA431]
MIELIPHLLHQALFGALAAAGFGVLFNFGVRALPWCAAAGALALAVRTFGQDLAWSLEGATFAAAIVTSFTVSFLHRQLGPACNAVALAGCIPMVPGAFLGQALLGLFALTAPNVAEPHVLLTDAAVSMIRVIFTLGAIGAGLAIPAQLLRNQDF